MNTQNLEHRSFQIYGKRAKHTYFAPGNFLSASRNHFFMIYANAFEDQSANRTKHPSEALKKLIRFSINRIAHRIQRAGKIYKTLIHPQSNFISLVSVKVWVN